MGCSLSTEQKGSQENGGQSEGSTDQKAANGLTWAKKKLIRSTWAAFKEGDYQKDATYIFVVLFRTMPETFELFDMNMASPAEEDVLGNEFMEKHVQRVVSALGLTVDCMDNLKTMAMVTKELGRRHAKYGVKPEHLGAMVDGIVHALQRKLKDQLTEDAKAAWLELLSFVGTNMTLGMREDEEEMSKKKQGKEPETVAE